MKTLKRIIKEDKKNRIYYLHKCDFCNEELVVDISDFWVSDNNMTMFKCCNCGSIQKLSQSDAYKTPCNRDGEILKRS